MANATYQQPNWDIPTSGYGGTLPLQYRGALGGTGKGSTAATWKAQPALPSQKSGVSAWDRYMAQLAEWNKQQAQYEAARQASEAINAKNQADWLASRMTGTYQPGMQGTRRVPLTDIERARLIDQEMTGKQMTQISQAYSRQQQVNSTLASEIWKWGVSPLIYGRDNPYQETPQLSTTTHPWRTPMTQEIPFNYQWAGANNAFGAPKTLATTAHAPLSKINPDWSLNWSVADYAHPRFPIDIDLNNSFYAKKNLPLTQAALNALNQGGNTYPPFPTYPRYGGGGGTTWYPPTATVNDWYYGLMSWRR